MNELKATVLKQRLIPLPKKLTIKDGAAFHLKNQSIITISTAKQEVIPEEITRLTTAYWDIKPTLTLKHNPKNKAMGEDAYNIAVKEKEVNIDAMGRTGVLNALKTLRQLAEVNRGTQRTEGYFLPQCSIIDEPAMPFRGIHLCLFPETPLWDLEKDIRIAAYHKFNVAVIECWGVFPFQSHPEIGWPNQKINAADLKRLIHLGKELGITLVPQLNILGHAAMARGGTGKHATLDLNPSLQPLFEPDGWSWCLTNQHTRQWLTDLVLELHDFFECPPFFHIGCDEAYNLGTCDQCLRFPLHTLVKDHILFFHALLKQRGTRTIMWHDMLLERSDPRWTGYIAFGLDHQKLNRLYEELPRDIIIADWQYYYNQKTPQDPEPTWPTMKFFKQQNFTVIGCPWKNKKGIVSIGNCIDREQLFGMLETTWQSCHGDEHEIVFGIAANAAWNPRSCLNYDWMTFRMAHTTHLRQVGWDMHVTESERTGWNMKQLNPGNQMN